MGRQLAAGQNVAVSSFTGRLERVVVRDLGDVVLICRKEEYEKAAKEAREPVCVGFKKTDLLTSVRNAST